MGKFDNLDMVADALGDGGFFGQDETFETVEHLVDALVDRGNDDKVLVRHDDHLGLKQSLTNAFLKTPLIDIDEDVFADEISRVLDEANVIIPLANRVLSDDDEDEIREDIQYRGGNPDDY